MDKNNIIKLLLMDIDNIINILVTAKDPQTIKDFNRLLNMNIKALLQLKL